MNNKDELKSYINQIEREVNLIDGCDVEVRRELMNLAQSIINKVSSYARINKEK